MVAAADRADKGTLGLILLAVVLYGASARFVTGPADTAIWIAVYVVQWGIYLLTIRRLGDGGRFALALVVLGALAGRLILTNSTVWLSDDLYRYLLDGRMLARGINPFRYLPSSPVVVALEPGLSALVNHPDVPTIYPPLAQAMGLIAAWLRLGADGWRVLISLVDVGAVLAVFRLFGGGGRGVRAAAVYGLCPLAVFEAGANGHLEPLAALTLVIAIHLWGRDRPLAAGMALGAAALVKLYPLLLLPVFLGRTGFWRLFSASVFVFVVGVAPFAVGGVDITVGLRTYLAQWSFNSPIHGALGWLIGQDLPLRVAPFAVIVGGGVIAAVRRWDIVWSLPRLLFAFLVVGPTLHPWYALWVLPWLGPKPDPGLLTFVGAMGLGYGVWWEVQRSGVWRLPPGLGAVIWLAVSIAWFVSIRNARTRKGI